MSLCLLEFWVPLHKINGSTNRNSGWCITERRGACWNQYRINSFREHLHVHCSPVCCNYVIWGSFVHVFDCQEGKGIHPCWAQWKLFFHATVLLMVVPNGQPLDTAFWGLKTLSIDHLLVAWQNIAGSWRQQPGVGGSCGCCTKYPAPRLRKHGLV